MLPETKEKPEFWYELRERFLAFARRPRRTAIRADGDHVDVSGDSSAGFEVEQLAIRAGIGLGAPEGDALRVWIAAVRDHLNERCSPLLSTNTHDSIDKRPGETRTVLISEIADPDSDSVDAPSEEIVSRLRRDGDVRRALLVERHGAGYHVIDDQDHRYLYRACVAAGLREVSCEVFDTASVPRVVETTSLVIDGFDGASADLCLAMETKAFAAAHAVAVPGTPPDAVPAPSSPKAFDIRDFDLDGAAGRRAAVEAFLAECSTIAGVTIRRKHIWQKGLKHKSPREFQHWMGVTRKTPNRAIDLNIRRILQAGPQAFVDGMRLRKHS